MRISFVASESTGIVAEGEITFDEPALHGLKLAGFSVRSGERGLYVTFPARAYGMGSERKYFEFLRPIVEGNKRASYALKDLILARYAERGNGS